MVPDDLTVVAPEDFDEFDEIKTCPRCGDAVKFGEMVWLNGECTCPICYLEKRILLDADRM